MPTLQVRLIICLAGRVGGPIRGMSALVDRVRVNDNNREPRQPLVLLVNPAMPAKTMTEFLELARKDAGKMTMGTAGAGRRYVTRAVVAVGPGFWTWLQ